MSVATRGTSAKAVPASSVAVKDSGKRFLDMHGFL
jgi:hypothetical protein